MLRQLWIPLVILVVIGAGGWTVSRLHGAFGAEKQRLYTDTRIGNTTSFSPKHMTYEVFGPPGTVASISYFDVDADPRRVEEAPLPWSVELTPYLLAGDNVLAVVVDSRQLNVPPDNPSVGAVAVDFLQPGGIYRDVALRVTPDVLIADVFAKPGPLNFALQCIGLKPAQCVYVGDSPEDVQMAKSANVRVIGVIGPFPTEKRLRKAKPDLLLTSIADLPEALKELSSPT